MGVHDWCAGPLSTPHPLPARMPQTACSADKISSAGRWRGMAEGLPLVVPRDRSLQTSRLFIWLTFRLIVMEMASTMRSS